MKSLFEYIKRLSGKDGQQNSKCHRQIPDLATLKKVYGYFDTDVNCDGEK